MDSGNEKVRVSMEDDRLSNLPDEIIHLILSFNVTKYAVQTSVLSSRWRLIWTTLPYLKFSTDEFRTLRRFSKFVKWVLSRRDNRTEVSRLDLYVSRPVNQHILTTIENYAVAHNVRKVDLFASETSPTDSEHEAKKLPLCFFSSQSLKHLSVKAYQLRNYISPWETPALTTLELNHVWLCADDTVCLDLFSKCVNLKTLTLGNCNSRRLKLMKILCPRLVHLTISFCKASKYEILAPNLSSFFYEGFYTQFLFTGGGLNSLEKLNLHMYMLCVTHFKEEKQRQAHDFMNILHEFRSARFVTLSARVIELLNCGCQHGILEGETR